MSYEEWRKSRVPREWNENMNDWQKEWETKCSYMCCYSCECADIRCAACTKSIVRPPPPRKMYSCIECPNIEREESEMDITYCENCFQDKCIAHIHSVFVEVNEKGKHSTVIRPVGHQNLQPITENHLVIHTWSEGEECVVCCLEFEEGTEKASLPGCDKQHGISGKPVCKYCLLYYLKSQPSLGNGYYSESIPPNMCIDCRKLEIINAQKEDLRSEMERIKKEFYEFVLHSSESGNGKNDLQFRYLFRNFESILSQDYEFNSMFDEVYQSLLLLLEHCNQKLEVGDWREFEINKYWSTSLLKFIALIHKHIHPQKYLHEFINNDYQDAKIDNE